MVASLVFLTPLGGFAASPSSYRSPARCRGASRAAGSDAARAAPPPPGRRLPRLLAFAAVPALLGAAATQPALRSPTTARVRTDAQAFFVIDISRSMLASAPRRPDAVRAREDRGDRAARGDPEIPSGVATLTDRVLPTSSRTRCGLRRHGHACGRGRDPPPENQNVVATSLAALGALGTQNFFPPSATRGSSWC